MTATTATPCYRHSRGTWIANCPQCTTWYLAAARARRDQATETTDLHATAPRVLRRLPRPRRGSGHRVVLQSVA